MHQEVCSYLRTQTHRPRVDVSLFLYFLLGIHHLELHGSRTEKRDNDNVNLQHNSFLFNLGQVIKTSLFSYSKSVRVMEHGD